MLMTQAHSASDARARKCLVAGSGVETHATFWDQFNYSDGGGVPGDAMSVQQLVIMLFRWRKLDKSQSYRV
jgi:hypothetical protein